MRKLLSFVLALGMLLALAACATPAPPEAATEPITPFDLAAYKAKLSVWGEADPVTHVVNPAPHIADAFQPLKACEGVLPDEAVLAFAHFLDCASEGLYNFEAEEYPLLTAYGHSVFADPDYPAVLEALEGKLSPGAVRWLELKAEANDCEVEIYEPDIDEGEMRLLFPSERLLDFAKAWCELETEYPEIAASEYAGYHRNNSGSWVDNYLDTGDNYGLSEESKALYVTRQKASMKEFLGNAANTRYPFYEDIYQFVNP